MLLYFTLPFSPPCTPFTLVPYSTTYLTRPSGFRKDLLETQKAYVARPSGFRKDLLEAQNAYVARPSGFRKDLLEAKTAYHLYLHIPLILLHYNNTIPYIGDVHEVMT